MAKNIIKIVAGLLMVASVLIGYIPQPKYLVELTCVSKFGLNKLIHMRKRARHGD